MDSKKTSDAMSRKINHIARCGAERALKRAQLVVGGFGCGFCEVEAAMRVSVAAQLGGSKSFLIGGPQDNAENTTCVVRCVGGGSVGDGLVVWCGGNNFFSFLE